MNECSPDGNTLLFVLIVAMTLVACVGMSLFYYYRISVEAFKRGLYAQTQRGCGYTEFLPAPKKERR